jgi:ABC-type transporter Mla maintaining outer membrane lipid asymmetry permease subunit MlaE
MKKLLFSVLFLSSFIGALTIQSCYYDSEEDLYGTGTTVTCDTAKVSFATLVMPTMTASCATTGCHRGTSASAGINLENYTAVKNYATRAKDVFLGSMYHNSSFSAMPKGAPKLPTCTVDKIAAWINAGMPNN